jgi:LysM repeat protein
VDARRRSELARYGAPAAFLAAATIAILLIKAGLSGSDGDTTTTTEALPTTTAVTTTAPTKKVTVTPSPSTTATTTTAGQYYTVASGDTLASIAAKYSTTVDELMRLNPGVDPTALHIGQKIRVS